MAIFNSTFSRPNRNQLLTKNASHLAVKSLQKYDPTKVIAPPKVLQIRFSSAGCQFEASHLVLMVLLEHLILLRRGFRLVFLLPLGVRHSVNNLLGLFFIELNSFILSRLSVPVTETISAKTRKIHEVDILYLFVLIQVLYQMSEYSGFKFNPGLIVHFKFSS